MAQHEIKTPGQIFWDNVHEILKENDKSLMNLAIGICDSDDNYEIRKAHDRIRRNKKDKYNPRDEFAVKVIEYLQQFDEYLMFSDLYAEE